MSSGKRFPGLAVAVAEVEKATSKNLETASGSQGWLSPYTEVEKATSKNLETASGGSQGWLSPYIRIRKATSKNLETASGSQGWLSL